MKPLNLLLITALNDAILVIAAFLIYEIVLDLRNEWKIKYPESVAFHKYYGALFHLVTVFISDMIIGGFIYMLFHVVV